MSEKKQIQKNQPENTNPSGLSQREWILVQNFRMLDEESQKDIIRFIKVFLIS